MFQQQGYMGNQMMGQQMMMGGQTQFEPPEEMKAFPLGNKWARSVEYDPQTGIVAMGHTQGGQLYNFMNGQLIKEIPEIGGETRLVFLGNNTYAILCSHLKDKLLIYTPNLQGGKPKFKTVVHGVDNRYSDCFLEKLSNGHVALAIGINIVIIDPQKCSVVAKLSKGTRLSRCKQLLGLPDGSLCSGLYFQREGENEGKYLETDTQFFHWNILQGTSQMFKPSMNTRNRCDCKGPAGMDYYASKNQVICCTGDYNTEAQIWAYQLPQLQCCGKMDWEWKLSDTERDKCKSVTSIKVIGTYVVCGLQGDMKVFSLQTFQLVHSMPGVHDRGGCVYDITAYLDQKMFFSASNKAVKVWSIPQSWLMGVQQQQQQQQQPQQQQMQNQQGGGGACQNCEKLKLENQQLKAQIVMLKQQQMGGQQGNNMMMGGRGGNMMMQGNNMMMQQQGGNMMQNNMMRGNNMMMQGNNMMGRGNMMGNNMMQGNNMMGNNMMNQQNRFGK